MTEQSAKSSAGLEQQLIDARKRVEELEALEAKTAYEAASETPGAIDNYQGLRSGLRAARAKVELLLKAVAHERDITARHERERIESEHRGIRERVLRIARRRAILVEKKLMPQLETVIDLYRELRTLSLDLFTAAPIKTHAGLLLMPQELRGLVSAEILRLDCVAGADPLKVATHFPRSDGVGLRDLNNPAALQSMAEKVAETVELLERYLDEQPNFPVSEPASSSGAGAAAVGHGDIAAARRPASELLIEAQREAEERDRRFAGTGAST